MYCDRQGSRQGYQGSTSFLRPPGSPGPGNFEHRPVLRSQERSGKEGGKSLLRCWALDVRCWTLNQFSNPREHPSDHCPLFTDYFPSPLCDFGTSGQGVVPLAGRRPLRENSLPLLSAAHSPHPWYCGAIRGSPLFHLFLAVPDPLLSMLSQSLIRCTSSIALA